MYKIILLFLLSIMFVSCEVVVDDNQSEGFMLLQNYPNPFDGITHIQYTLGHPGHTHLVVYDINGQQLTQLVDADLNSGQYSVIFDAANLPSGKYPYTLTVHNFSATMVMTVVK